MDDFPPNDPDKKPEAKASSLGNDLAAEFLAESDRFHDAFSKDLAAFRVENAEGDKALLEQITAVRVDVGSLASEIGKGLHGLQSSIGNLKDDLGGLDGSLKRLDGSLDGLTSSIKRLFIFVMIILLVGILYASYQQQQLLDRKTAAVALVRSTPPATQPYTIIINNLPPVVPDTPAVATP